MNDLQILERLSEADGYAPDMSMPAAAWTQDVTLAEIDRRIGRAMQPVKRSPASRPWRTGRLVAVGAFVTVLLVGVAVMLFSGSRDDVSPAVTETTQAPPTTQAAPSTTSAPPVATTAAETAIEKSTVQPIVDRFVGAYNVHDPEALLALLGPTATYESGLGSGGVEGLRTELTYSFAADATYDIIDCRFNPREDGSIRAACSAHYSDVIDPVLTGARTQSLGLTVADGIVTEVSFGMSNNIETLETFYSWVSEQHPDVAERMIACFNPPGCLLPVLTTESAELHGAMVEAYVVAVGA